jgi:uncharacterized damage-inducible protein DinB
MMAVSLMWWPWYTRLVYGLATQLRNEYFVKSAETMPAEHYSFKPADDVRTFGEVLGHVANAQYLFCSAAMGQSRPEVADVEKTMSTKEEILPALKEAFAYCDKAYAMLTMENAGDKLKFFRGERARIGILNFNTGHTYEHYGNMATYMRMKGQVPASSQGR